MKSSIQEGRLFNVRRLVALDMGLHGSKFILTEFSLGAPIPMILGLSLVLQGFLVFGAYIFTLGVNYVPFLAYAIALRKNYGYVVDMGAAETRKLNRKYSIQQFLIFIPFFTLALAVIQWFRSQSSGHSGNIANSMPASILPNTILTVSSGSGTRERRLQYLRFLYNQDSGGALDRRRPWNCSIGIPIADQVSESHGRQWLGRAPSQFKLRCY